MVLSEVPATVEKRQVELEALITEEFPEPEEKPHRAYEGPPGERIDLVEFLGVSGVRIVREILDSTAERVFAVVCPWAHEHGGGDTSGTRVGQYQDGALWFRCEHAHCAHRGWAEFREYVQPSVGFGRGKAYAHRRGAVSVG